MTRTGSEVEQAVSRTLRDSLEKLQQSNEYLNQALTDLVSACSSARPANSLPPMLRAQTAAASLAASLEVLSRFVTAALQPERRSEAEQEALSSLVQEFTSPDAAGTQPATPRPGLHLVPEVAPQTALEPVAQPPSQCETEASPAAPGSAPVISDAAMESQPQEPTEALRAADMEEEGSPVMTQPIASAPQAPEATISAEQPHVISQRDQQGQPAQPAEEQRASEMQEEGSPAAFEPPAPAVPPSLPPAEAHDVEVEAATVLASSSLAPSHAASEVSATTEHDASVEPQAGHEPAQVELPTVAPQSDIIPEAEAQETPQVLASAPMAPSVADVTAGVKAFDVSTLSPQVQELHKRANRVAKVSMQDIRMLRPNDVKLGKEHKDLCHRLRDDIERAHKEYDRRFQTILNHPVDYFYDWMVQILADGDPEALGEYPYPSPVVRH